MFRIKELVVRDGMSIGLLAAALFFCLVALTAAARPTHASIPERFLGRVHGANPDYYQWPDPNTPNCNFLEAAYLDAFYGVTAVPWTGCNAANVGTMCVECDQQTTNTLKTPNNGFPKVFTDMWLTFSCDVGTSQYGSCVQLGLQTFCNFTDRWTCTPSAIVYQREPAGN